MSVFFSIGRITRPTILAVCLLTDWTPAFAQRLHLEGGRLKNFYRVDEGVYRSDQPSPKDFVLLEQYGIREVLNLRNHHSDDREAAGTRLVLHRIKSRASTLSEADIREAMRIIRDRKGPILIHCWHGSDRTGTIVAMYKIIFQGESKEEAIREMQEGGYGFHEIFSNLPKLIHRIDTEAMKRELGL